MGILDDIEKRFAKQVGTNVASQDEDSVDSDSSFSDDSSCFDGTVVLYDEDGNEIEFNMIHHCEYRGLPHFVLWGEDESSDDDDDDAFVIARENEYGEIEVVEDEDAIAFVQASYSDALPDSFDEFIKELNDVLDGVAITTEHAAGNDAIAVKSFDSKGYTKYSQDALFVQGNDALEVGNYADAMRLFAEARDLGNPFAATRLGTMHYDGKGCVQDRETALRYFREGAGSGDPLGAAWASECLRLGHGTEKNTQLAEKMYNDVKFDLSRMCECGDAAASYFLGFNLVMGVGGITDEAKGFRLLSQSYEKGYRRAALQLADCYYHGWGVDENPDRTVELLTKHPMPSNKKAEYLLALCSYFGKGMGKNYDAAFQHFRNAAELGHGRAKYFLASCYYHGQGANKDAAEAARWYQDAADNNGNVGSAYMLGLMYLDGDGVEADAAKAIEYLTQAAEGGDVDAQKMIAKEYISGYLDKNRFLERSPEKARDWMEKAAKQGDLEAQMTLGKYYMSDFSFQDEAKAFEWFMKAALQGDAEAEYTVGGCYKYGVGVAVDMRKGDEWLTKAAGHGSEKAKQELQSN